MLRIVTWNMDHWRRSSELRAEAWGYLGARLKPDVALVQEALPVDQQRPTVFRPGGVFDDRKAPERDLGWGSAVVSYGPPLRAIESATSPFHSTPVPLLRTFPGSVAIARIGDEGPDDLVVISAYGVIDRGYADTTVHRILSDITPLVDERRARRMILAGDLNVTTQWSKKHRGFLRGLVDEQLRRDRTVFDRCAALGFENVVVRKLPGPLPGCECSDGDACRHVQTQRHDQSKFPWHNDYVFVTEDLLERRATAEAVDDDEAWRLSSHCPITVEVPT